MYTNPAVGTIFPAQPNTTVVNPGPVQSEKGDALNEWLQAQAQDNAYKKNLILVQDWTNGTFNNWLTNYQAARVKGPKGMGDPDAPPPDPPAAFVVTVFSAPAGGITFDVRRSGIRPTEDKDGNVADPGTGPYIPACDPPQYDKITAPQKPGTGKIKS
jgi:hypothetical protein